jgi:hypothetical protein
VNESHFNRGSWLALGAASLLILIVLGVNAYRFTLPTDGWIYDGFGGGFSTDLLGLSSGIQPGDQPVSIGGIHIEQISGDSLFIPVNAPESWRAGNTIQYTLKRGDETLSLEVPIVSWDLATAGRALIIWLRSFWTDILIAIFYFLIGVFVFFRRPGNLAAQVLLFLGAVQLSMNLLFPLTLGDYMDPFAFKAVTLLGNYIWGILLFPTLFLLSLVFPRPKHPFSTHPRLTLAGLYLLEPLALLLFGRLSALAGAIIGFSLVAVYGLLTVLSIVHSFFRMRDDPVARAQLMWVGLGIAVMACYQFVSNTILLSTNFESFFLQTSWWMSLINGMVWLSLPTFVAIAILRYRLFDIDVIIRRTIVYSVLTGILAALYYSSVVLLQQIARLLTGQAGQSQLAIVVSTLGIAALFNPLRRRVQDIIDRRFYRQRYDAERTLDDFAARLRDETDLDVLSRQVEATVSKTMQPLKVQLWLRSSPSVATPRFSVGGRVEKAGEGGSKR